jgi:REP element-mobilizing transposase RayT
VEYPGAFYHVISRGNGGERIFRTDNDYTKLLEYLGKATERFGVTVHTYCLMSNHYHLLIETAQPNLSAAIQWVNVAYAGYFNRRHRRTGHLFQGRFKALLIEADEYLIPLSRYIHLNPVRAAIVANPVEYRWSSYAAFVGKAKSPDFLVTDQLLIRFGRSGEEAIRAYRSFVEEVDIQSLRNPAERAAGGFILGGDGFVQWVRDAFLSSRDEEREVPQLRKLRPRVSLERIVHAVCEELGCREGQLRAKGSKRNTPRDLAVYLARDLSGRKARDLGEFFGGISGAAITMKYIQACQQLALDRKLRRKIEGIKEKIFNI